MREHKCPECPYRAVFIFQMKNHMTFHNFPKIELLFKCTEAIESLKCFQCVGFQTQNLVDLGHHLKGDHTPLRLEKSLNRCRTCSFRSHSRFQWFQCEHCSYRGKTKSNLRNHADYMHADEKRQRCDRCTFESRSRHLLKNHVLSRHAEGADVQWRECDQCSYRTRIKSLLKKHVDYKHSEGKHLKCEHCAFEAKSRQSLKYHALAKHTGLEEIQWFGCEQCTYKTKMKFSLKRHVDRVHRPLQI